MFGLRNAAFAEPSRQVLGQWAQNLHYMIRVGSGTYLDSEGCGPVVAKYLLSVWSGVK